VARGWGGRVRVSRNYEPCELKPEGILYCILDEKKTQKQEQKGEGLRGGGWGVMNIFPFLLVFRLERKISAPW